VLEIPSNLKKVSIHFRMKGKPPALYRHAGVELVEPTNEQAAARAKYAEEHRGELLFSTIENGKSGLTYGASLDALNQLKLVRATVEERWTRGYSVDEDERGDNTFFVPPYPYCWFTFTHIKSPSPQTQVLGEDSKRAFEARFQSAWTDVRVYRNPIVKDNVVLDESALSIVFASPGMMPATYEFGDEIVFGIRRVVNRNPKLNRDRKPRAGLSLPQ